MELDFKKLNREDMQTKAREQAEKLYRNGDYLCSEAVLLTINDLLDKPFQKDIVKLASGFPVGFGGSGCSCGAVSGGVMALGLAFGRSNPGENNETVMKASKELHDWFIQENDSNCCRVLIKDFEFGSEDHLKQCIYFTGQVAEKTIELIFKYHQ
ncbi:C-GCAxxG-C-C family protein [Natranaerobius thermophilus]|uniref:C_GCAxxG_C_C family protein n=1 Tax=Natranaerobius thermophilus (strain ATCC BAA-1301 / DSM 18059 / JW/NM-WN-LF) TaxID=457570 RepID=B2A7W8_NATTJ|nr:C-GCAxxG-C-C family protein [Natranaerobius thermophilus]ACB84416.1 C_GCAxxG_C_C family protein [Natranaerobius thermophilus JW/NM-WN-LF]